MGTVKIWGTYCPLHAELSTPCGKGAGLKSRDDAFGMALVLAGRPLILGCSVVAKPEREESNRVICHTQVPKTVTKGQNEAKSAWRMQSSVSITGSGHFLAFAHILPANLPTMAQKDSSLQY